MRVRTRLGALVVGGCLLITGCGGAGIEDAARAKTENVEDRGPITYVQGKDNSSVVRPLIEKWNAAHPGEEVTFKEQSDNADQQHEDLVQHFQAEDEDYDVVSVDLVWTAEFAARNWLQPLEGDLSVDTSALLPATIAGASYGDTLFAAPHTSDGALLYYRTDLVDTPPTTWDEMTAACPVARQAGIDCYAGQFAQYEGLTVNLVEAINSAGGSVVADDGVTPTLDSPESRAALQRIVDGFATGDIPRSAITFQEEQGRSAFQSGSLMFMRNWPYAYGLLNGEGSTVAGRVGIAPIPGVTGTGRSALGGHNAAISVFSDHKATARDFLAYLLEPDQQRFVLEQGSLAPVRADIYGDQSLVSDFPYLPVLKTSIENAVPRPATPYYPAVTRALQNNAASAIKGETSVGDALASAAASIDVAGN